VEIWQLPPRKWKWRMRGSAYHFAARAREAGPGEAPDVVFASDFLNLADWRALTPPEFGRAPCAFYFHENQIGYPLSDHAPVEHHYGWINLSSALAADSVLFNSLYHREQFLGEVSKVLRRMPDPVPPTLVDELRDRSEVFPVGIDFAPHDEFVPARTKWPDAATGDPDASGAPIIVWNHRWEYDKRPDLFAAALIELARRGRAFRSIVCGESFDKQLPEFEELRRVLGGRLLHLGYFEKASDYRAALAGSNVVVSTARHEFFGVSVVEAMYLGCLPMLPADLSYPEIVPPHLHPLFLYRETDDLADRLEELLARPPLEYGDELRGVAARYDWRRLAPLLDERLADLVRQSVT